MLTLPGMDMFGGCIGWLSNRSTTKKI